MPDPLIAFSSALTLSALAALFAYLRQSRQLVRAQRLQSKALVNSLFAELANIFEHYTYAAAEFPKASDDTFELNKRLKWSRYGTVRSASDIDRLGLLDAGSVRALLQLELRIRNDDTLLDQILENADKATPSLLEDARKRLLGRAEDVCWLLEKLVVEYPELKEPWKQVKESLGGQK